LTGVFLPGEIFRTSPKILTEDSYPVFEYPPAGDEG
jgi:hypothetical protein